jgi:hypothetical protein
MLKVGLRFRKSDARLLRHLADRVRNGEIQGTLSTFENAAEAARSGEPLIVVCDVLEEAHQMAALYRGCGTSMPAVEALSGR